MTTIKSWEYIFKYEISLRMWSRGGYWISACVGAWLLHGFVLSGSREQTKAGITLQRVYRKYGTSQLYLCEWQYLVKSRKHKSIMIKTSLFSHCTDACKTTWSGSSFCLEKLFGKTWGKIHEAVEKEEAEKLWSSLDSTTLARRTIYFSRNASHLFSLSFAAA